MLPIILGDTDVDNLIRIYLDSLETDEIILEIKNLLTSQRSFALILFDVDKSAKLRDVSLDIKIGVLGELIEFIRGNLKSNAIVIGNGTRDEIAILLPISSLDVDVIDYSMTIANEIRVQISESVFGRTKEYICRLTVSGGVAIYPLHGSVDQELYLQAEGACKLAKERGRNRCELAHPGYDYMLQAMISKERFNQLAEISSLLGVPISELIRKAIQMVLQRHSGLEKFSKAVVDLYKK